MLNDYNNIYKIEHIVYFKTYKTDQGIMQCEGVLTNGEEFVCEMNQITTQPANGWLVRQEPLEGGTYYVEINKIIGRTILGEPQVSGVDKWYIDSQTKYETETLEEAKEIARSVVPRGQTIQVVGNKGEDIPTQVADGYFYVEQEDSSKTQTSNGILGFFK